MKNKHRKKCNNKNDDGNDTVTNVCLHKKWIHTYKYVGIVLIIIEKLFDGKVKVVFCNNHFPRYYYYYYSTSRKMFIGGVPSIWFEYTHLSQNSDFNFFFSFECSIHTDYSIIIHKIYIRNCDTTNYITKILLPLPMITYYYDDGYCQYKLYYYTYRRT